MQENGNTYITLRVKTIIEEVNSFRIFTFEDGHGLKYKAGQYITLVKFHGNKEIRRSYSIISAPELNEPLSIGVKRIDNGFFSRHLVDHVQPGDEVLCVGTGGFFVLPDDAETYAEVFFFAAGSGITPIYALIKTALHTCPRLKLTLVYSNSSTHTAVLLQELKTLAQHFPSQIHLKLLLSDNPRLMEARLHRDMIFGFIERSRIKDKSKIICYICGPENYMRLCTYSLREIGIPADNIRKENFIIDTGSKKAALPPDKQTRTAVIKRNSVMIELVVKYPDSILQTAKHAGINLPYSCETGRCGSCVAKLIKGKVWHSYNEVLTDKDMADGLILTCVGHPVDGDIELQM